MSIERDDVPLRGTSPLMVVVRNKKNNEMMEPVLYLLEMFAMFAGWAIFTITYCRFWKRLSWFLTLSLTALILVLTFYAQVAIADTIWIGASDSSPFTIFSYSLLLAVQLFLPFVLTAVYLIKIKKRIRT